MRKTPILIALMFFLTSYIYSQSNVKDFNGIWMSSEDENNFQIMNNGRSLNFYFNEENIIVKPKYYGFCVDISAIKADSLGIKFIKYLNTEITINKKFLGIGDGDINFVYDFEMTPTHLILFGNKDLHFDKIKKLSPLLENRLRIECKKKNINIDYFLGIENQNSSQKADIKITLSIKTPIYTEPDKPSKMYLVKGNIVTVLQEKGNWVYILFVTNKNKEIKGWVKKENISSNP